MICFFVTQRYRAPLRDFVQKWGTSIADHVRIAPYESLLKAGSIPKASVYVFADIERLGAARQALATAMFHRLQELGAGVRILNHPERTLRRYDLLRTLEAEGINRFRARPLDEPLDDLRYPVFLRSANDHRGGRTVLLHDDSQVIRAARTLVRRGCRQTDLLVTEFCDTSDDQGRYRKYGAFVLDGRIMPRHVWIGHEWMIKKPQLVDDELRSEPYDYVRDNPHKEQLQRVARLAGVEYGRIDYGVLDGRIQVWEVNTNPVVMQPSYRPRDMALHRGFAERIQEAFLRLDGGPGVSDNIPLTVDRDLASRVRREWWATAARDILQKNLARVERVISLPRSSLLLPLER